ncbi:MAG: hypothetical protein ACOVOD_10405, partial [Rhodoferax sp.]
MIFWGGQIRMILRGVSVCASGAGLSVGYLLKLLLRGQMKFVYALVTIWVFGSGANVEARILPKAANWMFTSTQGWECNGLATADAACACKMSSYDQYVVTLSDVSHAACFGLKSGRV